VGAKGRGVLECRPGRQREEGEGGLILAILFTLDFYKSARLMTFRWCSLFEPHSYNVQRTKSSLLYRSRYSSLRPALRVFFIDLWTMVCAEETIVGANQAA
jgi:hypothetical protein